MTCGCADYGDPWTDEDQGPITTAKAIAWDLDHPRVVLGGEDDRG